MLIKNIIFDLGGVILKDMPISILDNMNIDENIYNQLKIFFYDWKKIDLGEETLEDKYNQCNFPKEYDNLYRDKLLIYYKYRDINMNLIDCISKLKNNGYNVYIISDNNKECIEYYKNIDTFKDIDGWIISCDYQELKKDGKLFDIFLNTFNVNPNECYFIDDRLINIEQAIKYGIKGFLYNNSMDELYSDMINNNINIK